MISAKDLMIGDWVLNSNTLCRISALYNRSEHCTVEYETKELVHPAQNPGEIAYILGDAMYSTLQPIPLTPEILEKNGFKYEERHGFRINSDLLYVCIQKYDDDDYQEGLAPNTYITGGNSDYGDEGVYFYLNYVHELQHALKLCEIEKEVEV